MREDVEMWIERLEEAARQYCRDDFCDKNAANIESYDRCMASISVLDELLKGTVVMGGTY